MANNASEPGFFSEKTLDDLRERMPIHQLLASRYNVAFKRSGKNYMARCPAPDHKDSSPSFSVDTAKQVCHCHGCGFGGNVFQVVQSLDHLTFPEAVRAVAAAAGVSLDSPSPEAVKTQQRNDVLQAMLNQTQQIYRRNLSIDPHSTAAQTLAKRGISAEMQARFGLGAAFDQWTLVTDHFGGYQRARLLSDAGLAVYEPKTASSRAKLYDRFRDGLVFPIRAINGEVISFAQRLPEGRKPKYINGPETALFKKNRELYGLYESLQTDRSPARFVVTEGYIDVITAHEHGFTNTVATMGTAISDAHIRKLLRYSDTICFCFDGDKAGHHAARKALSVVLPYANEQTAFQFCFLPPDHDPDSLLKAEGAAAYQETLDGALSLSKYMIQAVLDGRDLRSRESLARVGIEISDMLSSMPDSLLRDDLRRSFEQLTGFSLTRGIDVNVVADRLPVMDEAALKRAIGQRVIEHTGMAPEEFNVNVALNARVVPDTAQGTAAFGVLALGIPPGASLADKQNLLYRAMEGVVINSSLSSTIDGTTLTMRQVLANVDTDGSGTGRDANLQMVSKALLQQMHLSVDYAQLIASLTDEVERITTLAAQLRRDAPQARGAVDDAVRSFSVSVRRSLPSFIAFCSLAPTQDRHSHAQRNIERFQRQLAWLDQVVAPGRPSPAGRLQPS